MPRKVVPQALKRNHPFNVGNRVAVVYWSDDDEYYRGGVVTWRNNQMFVNDDDGDRKWVHERKVNSSPVDDADRQAFRAHLLDVLQWGLGSPPYGGGGQKECFEATVGGYDKSKSYCLECDDGDTSEWIDLAHSYIAHSAN